jgi:hypothetical protein
MAIANDRRRVVLDEVGQVRRMSDVDGLNIVRMDGSLERRRDLARRLESAGLSVDTNNDEWRTAGQFISGRLTSLSDGSEVNYREVVTAQVTGLTPDTHVRIIVHSPRSGLWPQAELRSVQEGRLRTSATFGRNQESDAGNDFTLMLVVANQDASVVLEDSRGQAMSRLPPGVQVLDQATVTRRRVASSGSG